MAVGTGGACPMACARLGAEILQRSRTMRTAHHRTTSALANVDDELRVRVSLS